MCYILLAINQSKNYPFILAANRDEFYQRESAQLAFWHDKPFIAGGRDLEQAGTWMAVTTTGRFAAVTNYREVADKPESARSRGLLITDFLESCSDIADFSAELTRHAQCYSGYNLIYGQLPDRLFYFSNRSAGKPVTLSPGIYALSNHLLDTPWPKVKLGKRAFKDIIIKNANGNINSKLFSLLADQTQAPAGELPNTGVDNSLETLLSSIYIESDHYGTRCSSVITVDASCCLNFTELTHTPPADLPVNPTALRFNLKSNNQDV